jgi:hypothetical protein
VDVRNIVARSARAKGAGAFLFFFFFFFSLLFAISKSVIRAPPRVDSLPVVLLVNWWYRRRKFNIVADNPGVSSSRVVSYRDQGWLKGKLRSAKVALSLETPPLSLSLSLSLSRSFFFSTF